MSHKWLLSKESLPQGHIIQGRNCTSGLHPELHGYNHCREQALQRELVRPSLPGLQPSSSSCLIGKYIILCHNCSDYIWPAVPSVGTCKHLQDSKKWGHPFFQALESLWKTLTDFSGRLGAISGPLLLGRNEMRVFHLSIHPLFKNTTVTGPSAAACNSDTEVFVASTLEYRIIFMQ